MADLDVLDQATPAADTEVDGKSEQEPDRPRIASAGVRHERDDPDRQREGGAEKRRHGDVTATNQDVQGRPERPRQVGLAEPQTDHRHLRRGERQQDPERVEAREEDDAVADQARADHERDRDRRGGDDRVRRDERAAIQPAERAWELTVPAE